MTEDLMDLRERTVRELLAIVCTFNNEMAELHLLDDPDVPDEGAWDLDICLSLVLSVVGMRLRKGTGLPCEVISDAVRPHGEVLLEAMAKVHNLAAAELMKGGE